MRGIRKGNRGARGQLICTSGRQELEQEGPDGQTSWQGSLAGAGREGNPRTAPTIATRDHRMQRRPAPDRTRATTGCDCGPRPIGQPRAHEKGNMPKGKRRHGMGTPGARTGRRRGSRRAARRRIRASPHNRGNVRNQDQPEAAPQRQVIPEPKAGTATLGEGAPGHAGNPQRQPRRARAINLHEWTAGVGTGRARWPNFMARLTGRGGERGESPNSSHHRHSRPQDATTARARSDTRDHRMRLRPAPDRTTKGARKRGNMPKGKRRHGMGTPGVKDGPPPRQTTGR
jgi:hypothetical protein